MKKAIPHHLTGETETLYSCENCDSMNIDYPDRFCKHCGVELSWDMRDYNKIIQEIINIPVKDRTQQQHNMLMKHYGGIRNYLLSMGQFKDVPIEDEELFIRKCLKCNTIQEMTERNVGNGQKCFWCPNCKDQIDKSAVEDVNK